VLAALGRGGRVRAALIGGAVRDAGATEVPCDLICVATGFEPAAGLLGQAGGRLRPDPATGRLVPPPPPPRREAAGEVAGVAGLPAILASGRLAGARAALALGDGQLAGRVAELTEALALAAPVATVRAALARAPRSGTKKFVCLCEDVTDKDLA